MRFTSLEDWLDWQSSSHTKEIDLGLDRVRVVAEKLGVLTPAPVVITVGGTNGKGSSVALLEVMLQAAGYSVGCFTSPHLIRYNERVRYNGQLASDLELIESFHRIDESCEDVTLTYFEWGALVALDIFTRADLDVVILEVGLGGRLDAVNIVDADVALITSLGVDHTEWLGETRELISLEKLGIARSGKPLVCSDPNPPEIFVTAAGDMGVDLSLSGIDFTFRKSSADWSWDCSSGSYANLHFPALEGGHQVINAAGVLMVLQCLPNITVEREAIDLGLSKVALEGRFERISGDINLVLDVAHNSDGSKKLADALLSTKVDGSDWCLLGVLSDKDAESMFQSLSEVIDYWVLVSPECDRALSIKKLTKAFQRVLPGKQYLEATSVENGYELVRQNMDPKDRLVVTGSFYTVAQLKEALN